MYCPNCGKEIGTESQFCPFCGTTTRTDGSAGTPEAPLTQQPPVQPAAPPPPQAAPPAAPPGAVPPPPEMGPAAQQAAYPQPAKKSALPWILGLVGLLVVAGVVLVLVFVVFKGDTSAVERPVVNFYESLEKRDVKMLVGTMEPDFTKQLKDILGKDYLDILEEQLFSEVPEDLDFTIRKMETEMKGEERALVTVVDGIMTYTDEYGDKVTEEAAEDMQAFEVLKVDGNWYISEDTLAELGFDLSKLEEIDMEDPYSDSGLDTDTLDRDDALADLPVDSEDDAINLVLQQPEVWSWFTDSESPLYMITDEGAVWGVYLYEEAPDGTELPFGWYAVDKMTGLVEAVPAEYEW